MLGSCRCYGSGRKVLLLYWYVVYGYVRFKVYKPLRGMLFLGSCVPGASILHKCRLSGTRLPLALSTIRG